MSDIIFSSLKGHNGNIITMLRFAHLVKCIIRTNITLPILALLGACFFLFIIKEIISLMEIEIGFLHKVNRIITISGLNVTDAFHYLFSFNKHTRKPIKAAATIAAEFK
jgi:hypothetical protein